MYTNSLAISFVFNHSAYARKTGFGGQVRILHSAIRIIHHHFNPSFASSQYLYYYSAKNNASHILTEFEIDDESI